VRNNVAEDDSLKVLGFDVPTFERSLYLCTTMQLEAGKSALWKLSACRAYKLWTTGAHHRFLLSRANYYTHVFVPLIFLGRYSCIVMLVRKYTSKTLSVGKTYRLSHKRSSLGLAYRAYWLCTLNYFVRTKRNILSRSCCLT